MSTLTLEEVDREISERTTELEALSASLVELDGHAGIEHVRRYPPSGITAVRWAAVEATLGQMWDGLRWMTSILDAAHTLRARSVHLDDRDVVELTRLLRERPLTVSPDGVALTKPGVGILGPAVERVGLADTAGRIRTAYPAAAEFLTAVDETSNQVAAGLAPFIKRLDELGETIPEDIAALLTESATDPLSFTAHDVQARLAVIARSVDVQVARSAEEAAFQANWPEAIATTGEQLDALHDALQQATHARAHAERSVLTAPLPEPIDRESDLRDRLTSLTEPDASTLRSLRQAIAAAEQEARESEELARGLLDRRSELHGRLKAYQAKAARLGIGEDRNLLAASAIAVDLLAHKPCDLQAATRAVTEFQHLITQQRGGR